MAYPITWLKPLPVSDEIEYPESDGKPMGETQIHILAMTYLLNALSYYFRAVADVYVSSDMLMYYEEGNPARFVVPDVFVVKSLDKQVRRTFKIWQERVPSVIFEITSKGTRFEDLANKRGLYEMLGVREYFLFDPLDEYMQPRLQGFRLRDISYEAIAPEADGDVFSQEMNLLLHPDDTLLRIIDPQTKMILPTFDEAMQEREMEMERAQIEAERAQAEAERAQTEAERAARAEQEIERLRTELARLRGEKTE